MRSGALIILDTHAWVWWSNAPEKLSTRARDEIGRADRVAVSTMSCLEIATLVRRRRITLDRDLSSWIQQGLSQPRVELVPVSGEIAVLAGELPQAFPSNPADRLIAATAIVWRAALVTSNARIQQSGAVRCVW